MTVVLRWRAASNRFISSRTAIQVTLRVSEDYVLYLTTEEVSERYRMEISPGTLRNWRAMNNRAIVLKIGKAVLYPLAELEAWDLKNLVICRATRIVNRSELDATG